MRRIAVPLVGAFASGMAPSLVAAALVFMPMGDEAKAAFVSSAMCGMIAASLAGGFFADSFGRIRAIRLAGLVALVSTPFICAHQGMFALALAGRFAQGVGLGLFSVLLPLYIAETQTADSRGRSMAFYQFFNSLGGIMGSFLCLAVASWGLTPSLAWRVDILLVFPVLAVFFVGSYLGKVGSDPMSHVGSDPTSPRVRRLLRSYARLQGTQPSVDMCSVITTRLALSAMPCWRMQKGATRLLS